jgi:hypothetical protein
MSSQDILEVLFKWRTAPLEDQMSFLFDDNVSRHQDKRTWPFLARPRQRVVILTFLRLHSMVLLDFFFLLPLSIRTTSYFCVCVHQEPNVSNPRDVVDELCLVSLEEEFEEAAQYIKEKTNLQLSDDVKLRFYSLFKQATTGPCNVPKPGMLEFVAKAKWYPTTLSF